MFERIFLKIDKIFHFSDHPNTAKVTIMAKQKNRVFLLRPGNPILSQIEACFNYHKQLLKERLSKHH